MSKSVFKRLDLHIETKLEAIAIIQHLQEENHKLKQAAELAIEAVDLAISMVPQNRVATKIWWEMVEKVEESKELMK